MSNNGRKRRTWNDPSSKKASPAPAIPTDVPAHPAYKEDPNGQDYLLNPEDDFAEDVQNGPFPQPAAPASVGWEPSHPAAKPDAGGMEPKQASPELQASVEKKAFKCIRIAMSMLGDSASLADIEKQSLVLMDLPEKSITASLDNIKKASGKTAWDDGLLAEFDLEGMEDGEPEWSYASEEDQLLAEMVREANSKEADHAGRSQNDPQAGFGIKDMPQAQMEKTFPENLQKKQSFLTAEEESMLNDMNKEADIDPVGIMGDDEIIMDEVDPMAEEIIINDLEEDEIMMTADLDPMGLSGEQSMSDSELEGLWGTPHFANDEGEEDKGEEDKEDDKKDDKKDDGKMPADLLEKFKKKASRLRPTPRKASQGAKTLGTVPTKTASSELSELENLWSKAPDVSETFGVPKSSK